MRLSGLFGLTVMIGTFLCSSCEKRELPIPLPQQGSAQIAQVTMGEDYDDQIFFDLETGQQVLKNYINTWDLAFESQPDGDHVFMNGGKNVFVYNTHQTDPSIVSFNAAELVSSMDWGFDSPTGLPDSTYIGKWKNANGLSKNEVYIIKLASDSFKKIVIAGDNDTSYTLKYGDINSSVLNTITIPKNNLYNYTYFSFNNGGTVVSMEPPKNTWDIVFTRYRHVYYDLNNFTYLVTGVLLNPYNTTALADSSTSFGAITYNSLDLGAFSKSRNVIGFDWKTYDFTTGRYVTNPNKCYVVKTRKDQYYRIHFMNFYDLNGYKGSPSFEYERIH
jgi:hypothetical protein